jgi:outer membrane protein, multidrug efflux system
MMEQEKWFCRIARECGKKPYMQLHKAVASSFALTHRNHSGQAGIFMRGFRAYPCMPNLHRNRGFRHAIVILFVLSVVTVLPTSAIAAPDAVAAPPSREQDADPMLSPPPQAPRQIASWTEALALIRNQSPDYVSSYQSVARAEAQRRIALAAVLPVLGGQASYTHQLLTGTLQFNGTSVQVPPPDVWAAEATLTWSVINPRAIYAVGTADRSTEFAKLSFEDRRRIIAMAIVDSMLSTLAAARVAELDRVGLRTALERLALTKARLQFGQGTPLDVDRAQQDVEAARQLILSGDESLRQSSEALGVAVGSRTPVAAPGNLDLEEFEGSVAHTCRLNDDIERRPDVASARMQLEIAQRAVHDAELQLSPSLGLSSQLGYASAVTLGPLTTWSVQGVVNVPLYDGGARYGAMRDARAAVEQSRQALVRARLAAIVQAAQAQRSVGLYQTSRDVAKEQRDLAQRIDSRTRDGYAHGLGTSLDLVTSAQALRQAETNLALLEFQVGSARAHAVLANAECLY